MMLADRPDGASVIFMVAFDGSPGGPTLDIYNSIANSVSISD